MALVNDIHSLEAFIQKRNQALIDFDLDFAEKAMPHLTKEQRILVMHKARYMCTDIPAELRHVSAKYLRDGGHYSNGEEILPEGLLSK